LATLIVDPISVIYFLGMKREITGDDILFLSNCLVDVVCGFGLGLCLSFSLLSGFLCLG
jgi:hypothetical protein